MIEAFVVTIFPAIFLIVLFGGGSLFRQKKIDQDGTAPINKTLFYASKYSILILWGAMVLQSWGINISSVEVPALAKWISLFLWISGFILLFIGRFGLGNSFRLGTPKESTNLRVDGIYGFSRKSPSSPGTVPTASWPMTSGERTHAYPSDPRNMWRSLPQIAA